MKPELKLVEDTGSQLDVDTFEFELPQQQEMPFAMVDGEPMTQLPRDLYIPPDALQVFLEAFEGPLDLLLYLIRRQNLDVLDIPIAEITRQYMAYIDVMSEMQLELAGEYLLMAAMLAEIKSRMLLPRPPAAEGADEEDPRAELVRRLQEYERFKKAAEDMDRLPRMERDTMPASAELIERKVVKIVPQVTLQEMLLALKDVMSRADMFAHHHVQRERLSVRQRMSDILGSLSESAFIEFTRLFRPEEGRMGVSVTFSAILELMKEGLIEIVQAEPYAPLHIRPASGGRHYAVVSDDGVAESAVDAENEAALAQPAYPDENDVDDDDEVEELLTAEETTEAVESEAVGAEVAELEVAELETAGTEVVESEVAELVGLESETVELESAETEGAELEVAELEAVELEVVESEVTEFVAIEAAAAVELETTGSEVAELESAETEVAELEAAEIEAVELEVMESEVAERVAIEAEAAVELETTEPEVAELVTVESEAAAIEVVEPEAFDSEAAELKALELELAELEAAELEAAKTEVAQPEVVDAHAQVVIDSTSDPVDESPESDSVTPAAGDIDNATDVADGTGSEPAPRNSHEE
ncbi:MAG TPA: ScpA family protein [Povalibacter sp.]